MLAVPDGQIRIAKILLETNTISAMQVKKADDIGKYIFDTGLKSKFEEMFAQFKESFETFVLNANNLQQ